MKSSSIEELVYQLKKNKDENLSKPIIFLGAGASKSGGVPLANEIVSDIIEKFKTNPRVVRNMSSDSYAKMIGCLQPSDRNNLLKNYIEKSKINITHIYLAQLMKMGYVDYVVTVNFDNLMLRALALFNEFPSTYDMAILKDLTTTAFKKKSVIYLHGQHHGLWLLNTDKEMAKVKSVIPKVFHSIKNERAWIFIGYSGNDPIFDHIVDLGRFDNGLYWVTYKDSLPNKKVRKKLLEKENTNSYIISGYDADSFMLRLNNLLKLPPPAIIDKPFSSLKNSLENIVDISNDNSYKTLKNRLAVVLEQVEQSIKNFEKGKFEVINVRVEQQKKLILKKDLISTVINENYSSSRINEIEKRVNEFDDNNLYELLSGLYYNWGCKYTDLGDGQSKQKSLKCYKKASEKFEKATELKKDFEDAFYNWGVVLRKISSLKIGDEKAEYLMQAFEKYSRAIIIKPLYYDACINWGMDLITLHRFFEEYGVIQESLISEALQKYESAKKINPKNGSAYNGIGLSYLLMAKNKSSPEKRANIIESIKNFKRAQLYNPEIYQTYVNWGNALDALAVLTENQQLFGKAIEKYRLAMKINPEIPVIYSNWGLTLVNWSEFKIQKERINTIKRAVKKFEKVIILSEDSSYTTYYNLASCYAKIIMTKDAINCERFLEKANNYYKKSININPEFFLAYRGWGGILVYVGDRESKKTKEGFYRQAFEKCAEAAKLNPLDHLSFFFCGYCLESISMLIKIKDREKLLYDSLKYYEESNKLNPNHSDTILGLGVVLGTIGRLSIGKKKEEYISKAMGKFEKAADLNTNDYRIFYGWGELLIDYGKTQNDKQAQEIFLKAIEKKTIASQLNGEYYDLASSYAVIDNKEKAFEFLKKALGNNENQPEFVENDKNWISYFNDEDFINMLNIFRKI